MYQMEITLPESLHCTKVLLKMDENQNQLIQIFLGYPIDENKKNRQRIFSLPVFL
jgi:hypothetical protein